MKIQISNFGPIDFLEFDIDKGLHLIYGKNAVGKSYAANCIYCLLKNLSPIVTNNIQHGDFSIELQKLTHTAIADLSNGETVDLSVQYTSFINEKLKLHIAQGFEISLNNTFPSLTNLSNKYSNNPFKIEVFSTSSESISFEPKGNDLLASYHNRNQESIIAKKGSDGTYELRSMETIIGTTISTPKLVLDLVIEHALLKVQSMAFKLSASIKDIYFIPAGRSGLHQTINAWGPIIAEISQYRFQLKNKKLEIPALTEPISDYFLDLSTINAAASNSNFDTIIQKIEENVLKGTVFYDEHSQQIYFRPKGLDLNLGLSETSSMAAEIAPIVIFLKHILNNRHSNNNTAHQVQEYAPNYGVIQSKQDIIFIEEPEAHLHPETQVALLEMLAELSTMDIKIFMTSHSNYMFNKMNNMLLDGRLDKDNVAVYHLIDGAGGSIKNVDMTVTADGVNDDNFQNISKMLYNERMNIYEK
jgi:energy-coupling factor transporter ATP-binding protein EcfA2